MKYYFGDLEAYSLSYYQIHKRVDAYVIGCKDFEGDEFIWDVSLENWFDKLVEKRETLTCFFHNLSGYDGQFLLPFLINKYSKNKVKWFVDPNKKIFQISIQFRWRDYDDLNYNGSPKRKKYTIFFRDSWKLWPMPISALGKAVGKEKLDYGEYDILDEFPDKDSYAKHNQGKSLEYFERDIDIMREFAIQTQSLMPMDKYKMTIASTAMAEWKNTNPTLAKDIWWSTKHKHDSNVHNTVLDALSDHKDGDWVTDYEIWRNIKKAYKGGITFVKPKHTLSELTNVHVYDINSMYPAIMLQEKMPYGRPVMKESECTEQHTYRLYKVWIKQAKTDKMPFISKPDVLDNDVLDLLKGLEQGEIRHTDDLQYPSELNNCEVYMNNYTYELFEQCYEGEWSKTFILAHKEAYGAFTEYLNFFREIKENSKGAVRQLAKTFSNSLYGKFGQDIEDTFTGIYTLDEIGDQLKYKNKTAWLDGKQVIINDGIVYVPESNGLKRNISYIVIAQKITSLAQNKLTKAINENWENFVYCDTDSIHLLEPAKGIVLDDNNYGDWAFEGLWDKAVYRRAKHYYHINNNGEYELKGGGFQAGNYNPDNLSLEQYKEPEFMVENGKTNSFVVNGGVVITNGDYNFSMPRWWYDKEEFND